MKPATNDAIDNPNCHKGTVLGTPKGILAIITIGELNGMILAQTATGLSGTEIAADISAIEKMINMVIGKLKDCASRKSSLMALPIAPYKAE